MNQKIKTFTSFILIFCGIIMIIYTVNKEDKTHGIRVDSPLDSTSFSVSFKDILDKNISKQFIGLIILETNPCSSCINNTFDYIELLQDRNIPINILFVDKTKENIDTFVTRVNFNVPHYPVNSQDLPLNLIDSSNELFFVDLKKKSILYKVKLLGNITTTIDYKTKIINEALP